MGRRGEGHLYQPRFQTKAGENRNVGIWHWKAPSGRRYTTGLREKDSAERWVAERLLELHQDQPLTRAAAPLRYDDLEQMLIDDWTLRDRRGMLQAKARLKHLNRAFSGWHAAAITTDKVTAYALRRRQAGAAAATVNAEIATLHRAFVLAKRARRLGDVPIMDRLPGVVRRTGVVDRGDLEAILAALAPKYRAPIEALYWTGWRLSEVRCLTWQRVDLQGDELRLDTSKTGEPRVLCYSSIPALRTLLENAHRRRSFSPYVFPGRAGRPIDRTTLEKHWRRACRGAGVPDARIIHDLRRTATSDLFRAGVPLAVAMGITGHKTLGIHQGYSIVARRDQEAGTAQLVALRAGEPIQRQLSMIGR